MIETGYGNDYREARCIERAAIEAEDQCAAVNSGHAVPNILGCALFTLGRIRHPR